MENSALLVIDFINDIVHPDGKLSIASFITKNQVIEKSNALIKLARQLGKLIIFVKVGFSANYIECDERSPLFGKLKLSQALVVNTWGTQFHKDLSVKPEDNVLIKRRVSAFFGTDLEIILKANKIDTLLLSGVSTNMAVSTTARDAADRDYRTIVIPEACGAATQLIHEAAIESLREVAIISTLAEVEHTLFITK